MPKRSSKKSKPRDISQLARAIVEEATGESLADHALPKNPPKEPILKKNRQLLPSVSLAVRRAVQLVPRN